MSLFAKKKNTGKINDDTTKKTTATVNPDDIWNTPSKKSKTVTVKESKYGEAVTEKVDVESIEPEVIRDKMAQLEKELEAKKNKPVKTYMDYDVNPVHDEEIKDAQEEYEKLYKVEHEKFVASHKEEITIAQENGLDEKVRDMIKVHEDKVHEDETTDFGFPNVGEDEVAEKLSKLPYAKKPEDYPEYKDIKSADSVSDEEIEKLGRIDHSGDDDEIKSVNGEDLDKKVREFNEKYGNE